jgi:hypothetical protein
MEVQPAKAPRRMPVSTFWRGEPLERRASVPVPLQLSDGDIFSVHPDRIFIDKFFRTEVTYEDLRDLMQVAKCPYAIAALQYRYVRQRCPPDVTLRVLATLHAKGFLVPPLESLTALREELIMEAVRMGAVTREARLVIWGAPSDRRSQIEGCILVRGWKRFRAYARKKASPGNGSQYAALLAEWLRLSGVPDARVAKILKMRGPIGPWLDPRVLQTR